MAFRATEGVLASVLGSLLLVILAAPIGLLFCARLLQRQHSDTYDLRRVSRTMLVGPTSDRTSWRKPEVARLLLPPKSKSAPGSEPGTPSEFGQALARLSGELSGESKHLVGEAAEVTRRLNSSLATMDREIGRLTEELDEKESQRLRDRISKLGDTVEPDRRELRDLLQKQLALLDRSLTRRDDLVSQPARMLKLPRSLWQCAQRLCDASDHTAPGLLRETLRLARQEMGDPMDQEISSTSATLDRAE